MVAKVSIPKGNPAIYQTTSNNNQKITVIIIIGKINRKVLNSVTLFSLVLYFWIKPTMIIKKINNGVIIFPTLSAALKTNWAKSGVKFPRMNSGTKTGEIKTHFSILPGIKILIKTMKMNDTIINNMPVKSNRLIR